MEEFSFSYSKPLRDELFSGIEDISGLGIYEQQSFSPIYMRFFVLNDTNWNATAFDQSSQISSIVSIKDRHRVMGNVRDANDKLVPRDIFLKYSPLIDPIKYMTDKYGCGDDETKRNALLGLPGLPGAHKTGSDIANDTNNIPYVDAFFSYLTSKMLHHHNFIHALDFYGAWLGKQRGFHIDIIDDMDTLEESEFFVRNIGKLFSMDARVHDGIIQHSRANRRKIDLTESTAIPPGVLTLSDIGDIDEISTITGDCDVPASTDVLPDLEMIHSMEVNGDEDSGSTDCSSRSSHTASDCSEESERGDGDDSEVTDSEDDEDSAAMVALHDFPVQVSCLEKCASTLDALVAGTHLSDEDSQYEEKSDDELMPLTENEWSSMVMQVLMTLICYQKAFGFTHNDLHSNNIMYVRTQKANLYYRINGKHYKVPTYGRVFKIIDFGRSVYRFRGSVICSNAFAKGGEAAGQYNCEPFFDDTKPRLEPNYSFDLCRLATSLYDLIGPETEDEQFNLPIIKIILGWCNDDKGRNVLYKSDGSERYPDFKLYKMIVRTVHDHVPLKVLKNPYFDRYVVGRKTINKTQRIMNIDNMPIYTQ